MNQKSAIMMALGFEIVGIVGFAIYIGKALDDHYGLGGLGTAGAMAFGFTGWLVHIVVAVRAMQKNQKEAGDSPVDKDQQ